MLGDIDLNLKPIKPKIFLAKPNREIVSKISEAYDVNRKTSLTSLYELNFKIPFFIEVNNELVRNKNVDLIKERYHIQLKIGQKTEWYIVTLINDKMDDNGDYKEVKCLLLPQELNDKLIRGYSVDAYNARQVLNDILSQSNWTIDYLDADFELTYRSFEFPRNTLLEAVYSVAETYNAIVEWDTENRTVSLIKPELHGINRLGTFSYHKYLKSIDRESDGSKIVTRLIPEGKDGLTIHRVNPTGQGYLEDFSYFIYPFERDENRNVIRHSYYMSDSLCHALLDYKELIQANEGRFNELLQQKDSLDEQLAQKTVELNDLKNELAAITERQLAQQFDGVMFFEKFVFTGGTETKTFNVKPIYQYAVLVKVDDVIGKTLYINGQPSYMMSGTWVVSRKINSGVSPITVSISGSGTTEVFIQVANITSSEFSNPNNELEIIEKYNFDNKEMQIRAKQAEIDSIKEQIKYVEDNIDEIYNLLAPENNFTPEQLQELDAYITVEEFKDDRFIDDKDLFEEAKKRFNEVRIPQLSIKIDIVNFLEVLEEQGNWNQLYLGDKVIVKYEPFNLKVEAKIIEIEYDYEDGNINLTIANFKDLTTEREQLEKYIYDSNKTTSIVDLNKSKWGKAVVDTSEFSKIFDNFWDSVTKQINMANNEFVQIDARGITIIDPHDPLRFLRATHGVLAITRSGGLRYESAITPDGIIAERLLGKIILTQRVTIGDDDGIWLTEGPKTTITDRCGREVMKIGLYEENPDKFGILLNRYDPSVTCSTDIINKIIINESEGFKIQQKVGSSFVDVAWLDTDGLLNVKKLQIDFMDGTLSNGISIDSTDGIVVTRSDIMYRSIMNATRGFVIQQNVGTAQYPSWKDVIWADLQGTLHAQNINIANSFFINGRIELRDGFGGIMILDPSIGFWAGSEEFENAIASIGMDGTATFKKLIVKDGMNRLLIDSERGLVDFGGFDAVGAGRIEAQLLSAVFVAADVGFISDLTASRLSTLTNASLTGWSDYIVIRNKEALWVTGRVQGSGTHVTLPDGRPLYWANSSRMGLMTTEVTPWPVMQYDMDEKVKMRFTFEESGLEAYPSIYLGIGDEITELSGKAVITKPSDGLEIKSYAQVTAAERGIYLKDLGITIRVHYGFIKIEHSSGTNFTITQNGNDITMQHHTVGFITLNTNGMIVNINGNINISATGTININSNGQINFSGTQYNFA